MNNTLFRYSGNKNRLLKYYKSPTKDINRIIEPFAGSMAYSMTYNYLPRVGIELDTRIYNLWKFLQNATGSDVLEFDKWFKSHKQNFDIRLETDIPEEWASLARLNSGSMMTGHIDKNVIYPLAKPFNAQALIDKLPNIKTNFEIINGDCTKIDFDYKDTDLVFIDPPYIGSGESYGNNDITSSDISNLVDKISKCGSKIIFTNGNDSPKIYPNYKWEFIKQIINSKSRPNSSSRIRSEYACYINFD